MHTQGYNSFPVIVLCQRIVPASQVSANLIKARRVIDTCNVNGFLGTLHAWRSGGHNHETKV